MDECVASERTRGKITGYDHGCRCWKCSGAKAIVCAMYYERRRSNHRVVSDKYYAENRETILLRQKKNKSNPLAIARENLLRQRRRTERQLAELEVEGYANGS